MLLDFDVIKGRAAEILGVAADEVTDGALGELCGLSRETIWRWRHGTMRPRFETVQATAVALGLSMDDISAQSRPTPTPKPAPAPSTPKPPAAPKPRK